MKIVKQISTGKIIYRQSPDFEAGKGILNAKTLNPNIPETDMQEVEVVWTEAEWDTTMKSQLGYAEDRRREYPPMADYLDGIVKGDTAQVQAYIDACLAVKAKYPKE